MDTLKNHINRAATALVDAFERDARAFNWSVRAAHDMHEGNLGVFHDLDDDERKLLAEMAMLGNLVVLEARAERRKRSEGPGASNEPIKGEVAPPRPSPPPKLARILRHCFE